MFDLGCWLGLNFIPIDHMTSSSTGRCFVTSKSTKCGFYVCSYVMDCIRTGSVLENLQEYKVIKQHLPSKFQLISLGGDHLSILLWRVQSCGGAPGKAKVEWGAAKWRNRLWHGRCWTRWVCCCCWVQVSFNIWFILSFSAGLSSVQECHTRIVRGRRLWWRLSGVKHTGY